MPSKMSTPVKVFVNSDNTATLVCPNCEKTRLVDVSKYIQRDGHAKLKAKCGCGHNYLVALEKRKYFRKETDLEGTYRYAVSDAANGTSQGQGKLKVVNLSKTGMRLKLESIPRFELGDRITVEFRLDDNNKSLIHRDVYVRNIKDKFIGVEYVSQFSLDSTLGFYLFK